MQYINYIWKGIFFFFLDWDFLIWYGKSSNTGTQTPFINGMNLYKKFQGFRIIFQVHDNQNPSDFFFFFFYH